MNVNTLSSESCSVFVTFRHIRGGGTPSSASASPALLSPALPFLLSLSSVRTPRCAYITTYQLIPPSCSLCPASPASVRPRSAVCLSFPSGVPLSIALHPCLNLLLLLSPALPRHTAQCKTSSQGGVRGRLKTHCVLQVDKPLRGLGSPEE